MKVVLDVSEQEIEDLVRMGLGAIAYWGQAHRKEDGSFWVYVKEDLGGKRELDLTKRRLKTGIAAMAKHSPKQFGKWLANEWDAETGDIYIQCCLFGEVLFG